MTPRQDVAVAITLESQHNFYKGTSEDLSLGGLFIATDIVRAVGDCVRVRFALPGCPDILDAIAEVRWVRGRDTSDGPAGLGLQFLQMSARTKQSVRTYFAHQSSDL